MTEDKIYERYLHDNLFYYRISVITSFTKNSHSPREKRPYSKTGYTQTSDFNPHSHEGNDLICSFSLTFLIDFNPRSHEGNDSVTAVKTYSAIISIHVPTKGTTFAILVVPFDLHDFNPRSHEGNDPLPSVNISRSLHFNPRSHEGNDENTIYTFIYMYYFNPRSHEGNDNTVRNTTII